MASNLSRLFTDYLNGVKSVKDSSFTHTSITSPAGSYYIQTDCSNEFYKLYKNILREGNVPLYFTEKHRDISPVLIDFDFRFAIDTTERQYNLNHVRAIVKRYSEEIRKYIELKEDLQVYVMEKSKPSVVESKNVVKDGIHIVISNVVTTPSVQLLVRKKLLSDFSKILKDVGCTNTISDIFDECVICKNNWQMYGSRKPNCEAYKVTHHFSVDENHEFKNIDVVDDHSSYVEELSIRNKFDKTEIKQGKKDTIDKLNKEMQENEIDKKKKKNIFSRIVQTNENNFKSASEDLPLVRKLINLLSMDRATKYDDWIRLGWCLRNIDSSLLSVWDEFSMNSDKYEVGLCDQVWFRMREGGLGIGTLHMWARKDNPDAYKLIITADITSYIYKSLTGTDYDIALVIQRMFGHRYRCASHKHHIWYEYKNHRWQEIEKGYTLFYKEIPTLLFKEYHKVIHTENAKVLSTDDTCIHEMCQKNIDSLQKISKKLKSTSFVKDKMYKECSGLFYEPGLIDKLDANPSLVGFENGIYDLDTEEFREGQPEDYVSLTSGINFIEYNKDNPYVAQINDFMDKVLTNKNVRYYVWCLFASMLDGANRDEKFHIWTGSGSNGKSKIVELLQYAIGEYSCIFNVSLLTQKRVGSSATNSELAIAKGKRFAILQEPEENERLNVGLMKELTGGDKIQCRSLFKEPVKFKPMFKMILTCNHMPSIPPDDGGTWRRVRRVEFTSKFVDNPNSKNPNEFKIDRELNYKFDVWKETFMAILLKYYTEYKQLGKISEPKEVLDYTNEYQKKNDIFAEFCEGYVVEDTTGFVELTKLFSKFNEYCAVDNIKNKSIQKKVFKEAMEKRYGIVTKNRSIIGWKGISIVLLHPDNGSDDDI
jgi:P4 family phage/plasmid primase-like protien